MILAITVLETRFIILAIHFEDLVYDPINTILKISEIILTLVFSIRFVFRKK